MVDVRATELVSIPILRDLGEGDVEALRRLARRVEIASGDWLFRQGDEADCFYAILDGGLDLLVTTPSGSERLVAHLGLGSIVGETSLFIRGQRSASARATTGTALLSFPDDGLRQMLAEESIPAYRIVYRLAQALALRLRELDADIAAMSASEGGPPEDDLDRLRRIFFTDWGAGRPQGTI